MSFYYVKNTGTAVGDEGRFSTAQTGAFTNATSYPNINAVMSATTGLSDGDYIYCSDIHNHDYGATIIINFGSTTDMKISIISVSNSDRLVSSAGAEESNASGAVDDDIRFILPSRTTLNFIGITLTSNDRIYTDSNYIKLTSDNCILTSGGILYIAGHGATWFINNSTLNAESTIWELLAGNGIGFKLNNVTVGGSTIPTKFIEPYYTNNHSTIDNCDLTGLFASPATTPLIKADGFYMGSCDINIRRCKLDIDQLLISTIKKYLTAEVHAYSCDNGSGYHYFEHQYYQGSVEEDVTNYLTATWDKAETQGFSASLSTSAKATICNPLRYKLLEIPAQDITSDVTYKINFSSDTTLTDAMFWLDMVRPDAIDMALGVVQSTRVSDILAIGTNHDTNVEAWTGAGVNKYEDSVTITGMVGVDNGVVEIWVNLAEPSIDVWIDPLPVIT